MIQRIFFLFIILIASVNAQNNSYENVKPENKVILSAKNQSIFDHKVFRRSKKLTPKRTKPIKSNPFRDPNAPDMQLIRSTPSIEEVNKQAKEFLQNPDNIIPKEKYCSQCGVKNPPTATFCSECGEQFRSSR